MKPLTPALLTIEIVLLRVLWSTAQPLPQSAASAATSTTTSTPVRTCQLAAPSVLQLYSGNELGAGVVVQRGVAVTALHVVRAGNVTQRLPNGSAAKATVLARDAVNDLALVAVQDNVEPLPLSSDQFSGDLCSIGNSGNRINLKRGTFKRLEGDVVVSSVPLRPGDSGGALVDGQGRLVGVNVSVERDGTGQYRDVSRAVGVERVRELLKTMR